MCPWFFWFLLVLLCCWLFLAVETCSCSFHLWFGLMTIIIIAMGKHFDYTQADGRHSQACWWLKVFFYLLGHWLFVFGAHRLAAPARSWKKDKKVKGGSGGDRAACQRGIWGHNGRNKSDVNHLFAISLLWLQLRNGHLPGGALQKVLDVWVSCWHFRCWQFWAYMISLLFGTPFNVSYY